MKVLVTGASGFLGIHLVKALAARGHQVFALVRPTSSSASLLKESDAEIVYGDINDEPGLEKAMEGIDAVFHQAALSSFGGKDKNEFYRVNVEGTKNVLEAAKNKKIKRIIYTSTRGTLGHRPNLEPITEEDEAKPEDLVDDYLKSKFEAEKLAFSAAKTGLDCIIVNPTAFIGPRDCKPTPIGRIIKNFIKGRLPAYINGGINLADVRDVVDGHILALERGKTGEKYILGNENITIKNLLLLISKHSGVPMAKFEIPYFFALVAAFLAEKWARFTGGEPLISPAKVRTSKLTYYASSDRAINELGYAPRPLDETIKDVVVWFEESNKKI